MEDAWRQTIKATGTAIFFGGNAEKKSSHNYCKLIDVPDMEHRDCSGAVLNQALDFIETTSTVSPS